MLSIMKLLGFTLGIFLAYDTFNFMYEAHYTAVRTKQQLVVRPVYEAAEIRPRVIEPVLEEEDDLFLEAGFLAFMVCIASFLLMYFLRKRKSPMDGHVKEIETRRISEKCLDYVEKAANFRGIPSQPRESHLNIVGKPSRRTSNICLNTQSYMTPIADCDDSSHPSTAPYEKLRNALELAIESELRDEDRSEILDDDILCRDKERTIQDVVTESTLTQTETSTCDWNLEQFEERLAAVEHQSKTNTEITHGWSKRIERAEVDLVNLHRQMYTVLSKAEFVPPCSAFCVKRGGDSTPTSFLEPSLFKPGDAVSTGKQLESGDLFINQPKNPSANDNWSSVDELEDRIKELTTSASHELQEQLAPTLAPDHNNIKDALMKKKEELKEKTRGIVKAMEEAVKASAARKSKLSVHSHFVAPYKRIQNADSDNCSRAAVI